MIKNRRIQLENFKLSTIVHNRKSLLAIGAVSVGFAVVAMLLLRPTGAATYAVTAEAETGSVAGNAAEVADPSASQLKAVKFGVATVPDGPSLYVATTGSDTNPGTAAAPFKTIQKAASVATPGITVRVAPGTYSGSVNMSKSGTANSWIRYISTTKHAAVIVGTINLASNYTKVENFAVTGPSVRFGMDVTGSNLLIKGNKIHGLHKMSPNGDGGAGMEIFTDDYSAMQNITVDANQVYDIGLSPGENQLVQGIYVTTACAGCTVTNNLVYGIADFGLHAYHSPDGWTYANNTVFNCGRGILSGPNFTVINNISYNNGSDNFDIRGSATISNNLSFGTGSSAMGGVTRSDPQFVNYQANGSGDYRLMPNSPGLHKGTLVKAPLFDLVGTARPQGTGVDIGAYEQ